MATRPWVTPQQVQNYTEFDTVKNRTEEKLAVDISRAEQYVIRYTHNEFKDDDTIPEPVKNAVIILAESYAHNAVEKTKTLKSETFDDYSYTAESNVVDIADLDLGTLLDDYVIAGASGKLTMRLRKL
ncbi:MAG: DUF3199 family protein [Eubacterium sp.]|nr:DUF3199 family protein [Eubacterium sp.]MBR1761916.1 DUF3199 family protein [Eubacterium sp.]